MVNSGFFKKSYEVVIALNSLEQKKFSNAHQQIKLLKEMLHFITNNTSTTARREESKKIIAEIELLWRQEKTYWGMRSHTNWLKWEDKNTKYFHAIIVQRRHRNKISMLKVDGEYWCRKPSQLKKHIVGYYKLLYSSARARNNQPALDQCPLLVWNEVNDALLSEINLEEVQAAVYQLGAPKAPRPDGLSGQFYQSCWKEV